MNYQLLIESYCYGTMLSEQELDLLCLELDTQIINIDLSIDFEFFKPAPEHICIGLKLRKGTFWIMCLAEILDIHKNSLKGKTNSAKVYDLLLNKGIVIV